MRVLSFRVIGEASAGRQSLDEDTRPLTAFRGTLCLSHFTFCLPSSSFILFLFIHLHPSFRHLYLSFLPSLSILLSSASYSHPSSFLPVVSFLIFISLPTPFLLLFAASLNGSYFLHTPCLHALHPLLFAPPSPPPANAEGVHQLAVRQLHVDKDFGISSSGRTGSLCRLAAP